MSTASEKTIASNLRSSPSSMVEKNAEKVENTKLLFAAIRYLDDESKKIVAVSVNDVKGLDTSKSELNEFYHVRRGRKFVPAQLFKVCCTEKEALSDKGTRNVFKKKRVSAANMEIQKRDKNKAKDEAQEKRIKKKKLAKRDKELCADILNKNDQMWIVEKTNQAPQSVNKNNVKPQKNLNTKTNEELLNKRIHTLQSDKLDFSEKYVQKKLVVHDNVHNKTENTDGFNLSTNRAKQQVVYASVHQETENKIEVFGKNNVTMKKVPVTPGLNLDAIESVSDEPRVPVKNNIIVQDLQQQIKSMELSHQLAIDDYKEQLLHTTKRIDAIIAENQYLAKQLADISEKMTYYMHKYEEMQANVKLDEAHDLASNKSHSLRRDGDDAPNPEVFNGEDNDVIEISSTEGPAIRRTLSFSSESLKFEAEKVVVVKKEKSVPADLIQLISTPVRKENEYLSLPTKQEFSPSLSTTPFKVKRSANVPSRPSDIYNQVQVSKSSPTITHSRSTKRQAGNDSFTGSPRRVKYPRLDLDRDGSDDEKSYCNAAKESSESDYKSDKYPTFDHAGDFKSFEVEDDDGKKLKYYHFKFGFYVHYKDWLKLSLVTSPSIYVRKIANMLWKSTEILRRRALQHKKAKPINGEPRLPLTPQKKATLQKCFHHFLKRNYVRSRREQMKNKWRGFLSTYINSLNGQARDKSIKEAKKDKKRNNSASNAIQSDAESEDLF